VGQKAPRRLEVGVDIVTGCHLNCRNAHGGQSIT
jgi:hypothetical protein